MGKKMRMLSSSDVIALDNTTTKQNVVYRFSEWWSNVSLRRHILLVVFCLSLFACTSCSFSTSDVSVDEIAKEGYEAGYEDGFSFGGTFDIEDARTSFSLTYEAPKTQEEKEKYKIYVENYRKGFLEGKKNR